MSDEVEGPLLLPLALGAVAAVVWWGVWSLGVGPLVAADQLVAARAVALGTAAVLAASVGVVAARISGEAGVRARATVGAVAALHLAGVAGLAMGVIEGARAGVAASSPHVGEGLVLSPAWAASAFTSGMPSAVGVALAGWAGLAAVAGLAASLTAPGRVRGPRGAPVVGLVVWTIAEVTLVPMMGMFRELLATVVDTAVGRGVASPADAVGVELTLQLVLVGVAMFAPRAPRARAGVRWDLVVGLVFVGPLVGASGALRLAGLDEAPAWAAVVAMWCLGLGIRRALRLGLRVSWSFGDVLVGMASATLLGIGVVLAVNGPLLAAGLAVEVATFRPVAEAPGPRAMELASWVLLALHQGPSGFLNGAGVVWLMRRLRRNRPTPPSDDGPQASA